MCNIKFSQLFLTLPPNCYHLNCCTLCDQRLNYIMTSTYYIYVFVGLLWCSIINMNSIHVATITYKELANIFCESSTCLRYNLKVMTHVGMFVYVYAICIVFSIFYHVYIKHSQLISRYSCLFHKHFS